MARANLVAALGGALLVGLGVVLGSTLLVAPSDEATVSPSLPTARPVEEAEPADEGVRLGAGPADVDELRADVAALGRRLDALEEMARTDRDALKPLRDLYEAWEKREPGLAERIASDPNALVGLDDAAVEIELPHGPGVARALAASLKLDAARSNAFAGEVDALMDEVRRMEESHAEVTVDGDTTTIHLPAYPADGAALEQRWNDWLSANLTPDERERLVKQGATGKLFGSRLGAFDRRITIREAGGGIQVKEQATGPDGEEFQTEVQGPALGREFVLADYLHLLD